MSYRLRFTSQARSDLGRLERDEGLAERLKAVRKALGYLESNPRHRSLATHEFTSLSATAGRAIFEAYAENNTPAAYRIFWHCGPGRDQITIVAITAHP